MVKNSQLKHVPNNLTLHTQFRGLYTRVAAKANVDPSYVSRVARGQRQSEPITHLLRTEINRVLRRIES